MFHRFLVAFLLAVVASCVGEAAYADDTAAEPNSANQADVLRELGELRRLASQLNERIEALERTVAGAEGVSDSQPPLALDGYCPVELVENWKWVLGSPRFGAIHEGRTYLFKDAEAKSAFLMMPDRYAPVLRGSDAVAWFDDGKDVPGSREYGGTYDGRVYLFANKENLARFYAEAERYAKMVAERSADPESSTAESGSNQRANAAQQDERMPADRGTAEGPGRRRAAGCSTLRLRRILRPRRTR